MMNGQVDASSIGRPRSNPELSHVDLDRSSAGDPLGLCSFGVKTVNIERTGSSKKIAGRHSTGAKPMTTHDE